MSGLGIQLQIKSKLHSAGLTTQILRFRLTPLIQRDLFSLPQLCRLPLIQRHLLWPREEEERSTETSPPSWSPASMFEAEHPTLCTQQPRFRSKVCAVEAY